MKKNFLLSALLVLAVMANAQTPLTLTEGEPAIIYSLPKTEFAIEVETEKVTQVPGKFYRYSERYLATTNVITEEKTIYRLKSIRVVARAVPDPARTYAFVPAKGNSRITLDQNGILCGVNVPYKTMKEVRETKLGVLENVKAPLLGLGEEYMMAGSEAKMAEGAAKQIYRIRESRIGLLTADVERLPADGASFKSMIDGMNKLEQEMTELFVGRTTVEAQTQTIYLVPSADAATEVLFRLSALKGIVAKDDLSGAPYFINISPSKIPISSASRSAKTNVALYYVQPASTQVTIGDGVSTFYSQQFFVPQFGVTVPLPDNILKQANVKISIDPQTGRLLSVE